MKLIKYIIILFLLHFSVGLHAQKTTLYFDHILEYSYKTPSIQDGFIRLHFNSQDQYVLFHQFDPYLDEHEKMVVFNDGSIFRIGIDNDLLLSAVSKMTNESINPFKKNRVYYDLKQPVARKSSKSSAYECQTFEIEKSDGSSRRLCLNRAEFNTEVIFLLGSIGGDFLPLPFLEATYVGSNHLLVQAEVVHEELVSHSLNLELFRSDYYLFEIFHNSDPSATSLASLSNENNKLKYAASHIWEKYDQLGGLQYAPKVYEFDIMYRYEYLLNGYREAHIDFYFNTKDSYVAIKSSDLEDSLEIVLGFKTWQINAYYTNPVLNELFSLVYNMDEGFLNLDDETFLRAGGSVFRDRYTSFVPDEVHDEDLNLHWFRKKDFEPNEGTSAQHNLNEEFFALMQIEHDPRAMTINYADYISGFPAGFSILTPPFHILQYWQKKHYKGATEEIKLVDIQQTTFKFSDIEVPTFINMQDFK